MITPFGLRGGGSRCYLNSLLQAMFSCPSLNRAITSGTSAVAREYTNILQGRSADAAKLLDLILAALPSQIRVGQQADAHEALLALLAALGRSAEEMFWVRDSVLIRCSACSFASRPTCAEPTEIAIEIPADAQILNQADMQHFLKCRRVALDDYRCDHCGKCGSATLVRSLRRVSDVLVLLFAAAYSGSGAVRYFPEKLQFTSKNGLPINYMTIAQVEHYGSALAGHYTARAWRRHRVGNPAAGVYDFDDDRVRPTSAIFPSQHTYFVFYQKVKIAETKK